jgi:ATP-dependent Clp protease ATP-binding subunit ClpC
VGFEAGGQHTEAVRKRPYQVLLLDEIEKAHRDVLMAFLQVLDEGHLTDARGRRVDFTSTVVLLTSNLGVREAHAARTTRAVGFSAAERPASTDARGKGAQLEAAKAWLAPELYNRIDEVIVFAPLGPSDVEEVARRMLARLAASLDERGVALTVAADVPAALLASGGFEPELGARPMRRAIARLVEAPLAELLLRKDVVPGDEVAVEVHEGTLCLVPRRHPPARRSSTEKRATLERADGPTARGV